MDNQQAKKMMDIGWLIGFMEGEASFSLQKQIYRKQKPSIRPRTCASSTDFELIERMGLILEDMGIPKYFHRIKHDHRGWKDQMEIVIHGVKRNIRFLEQIIPLMTDSRKRKSAETLLEFCRLRMSKLHNAPYGKDEFALVEKLRSLNGYRQRQSLTDSTREVFTYKTKVESASA
jgi:hypothetical protein